MELFHLRIKTSKHFHIIPCIDNLKKRKEKENASSPVCYFFGKFLKLSFKKKKPSVFVGVKYSQQDLSFQCNDDSNKKRTMNFEYRIIKCALSYLGIYQRYVYVSI